MSNCRPGWHDQPAGTEGRRVSVVKELLERWEQACHEQRRGLDGAWNALPSIRHDLLADRIVTSEGYMQEVAGNHPAAPNARCIVHKRAAVGDRVWQHMAIEWVDAESGEERMQAGLQLLRFKGERLVEAWLVLSTVGPAQADAKTPTACRARSAAEPRSCGRRTGDRGSPVGCSRVGARP